MPPPATGVQLRRSTIRRSCRITKPVRSGLSAPRQFLDVFLAGPGLYGPFHQAAHLLQIAAALGQRLDDLVHAMRSLVRLDDEIRQRPRESGRGSAHRSTTPSRDNRTAFSKSAARTRCAACAPLWSPASAAPRPQQIRRVGVHGDGGRRAGVRLEDRVPRRTRRQVGPEELGAFAAGFAADGVSLPDQAADLQVAKTDPGRCECWAIAAGPRGARPLDPFPDRRSR